MNPRNFVRSRRGHRLDACRAGNEHGVWVRAAPTWFGRTSMHLPGQARAMDVFPRARARPGLRWDERDGPRLFKVL